MKHPDAIAWDEWLKAHEGAADPTTLGADPKMRQYLENRLSAAFSAGIEHGREHAFEQAVDNLRRTLTRPRP